MTVPPASSPQPPTPGAKLSGLRVLDLSLFLPGPWFTMMMADHGAEVIKLEPPGEGDPGRHIGLGEHGHSVFFRNMNRGKKSISLNLKNGDARAALLDLCATVDVFVEAFRPGVAARLGFDYPTVSARNPRIVYCSVSAFGQSGPYRDIPAHDLACEAYAGILSCNLGNDDEPAMPHVPAADLGASLMAFSAVMMALYRREQTGRGDRIDISMHDAAIAMTPNVLGPVFVEKRAPVCKEERSWGGGAFYRIYRTADGRHVVLGGQEPKFVRNLLEAWGRPDLIPLCERGPGPHQAPVAEFLAERFATRTQAEWVDWFKGRDICFAPVKNLREAFDDPQIAAREMRLLDSAQQEHIGVPIKFEHEPAQPDFACPSLGEHTEEVLRDAGFSAERIAQLKGSAG
ncbi:MAG TPA: CaiB/BaiF CoA-transferase family protein [Steroidobacteraceae bacterium]|nr:CaiB/BaiF CoA-transferase family protein [Steroidobacteraceae bacterium]